MPVAAMDLYTSNWFRKARACVEETGCPWRILSAEYGLVHPEEEIGPYEKTLNKMRVANGVLGRVVYLPGWRRASMALMRSFFLLANGIGSFSNRNCANEDLQ